MRLAGKPELQILRDLGNKASEDVQRIIEPVIDLAIDEVGGMGMFLICQRIAQFMIRGCGVAINETSKHKISCDDGELMALLMLASAGTEHPYSKAKEMFRKLMEREAPDLPGVLLEQ